MQENLEFLLLGGPYQPYRKDYSDLRYEMGTCPNLWNPWFDPS